MALETKKKKKTEVVHYIKFEYNSISHVLGVRARAIHEVVIHSIYPRGSFFIVTATRENSYWPRGVIKDGPGKTA